MGNTLKTTVLLAALSGLLLFIGDLLGGQIGAGHRLRLRRGDELRLLLVLGQDRAGDVPGAGRSGRTIRCTRSSQRLAQRAGLPMPKVYVIPDASPNAFATGRNPEHAAVAATEGILRLLSEDELAGVIAHELAHVKHRDILISSVAATIAAAIMFVAQMARFAAFFGGGAIATIAKAAATRSRCSR